MATSQDMHLLAERHILEGLKAGGWLQGDVQDMQDQRICALFMPHGEDHDRIALDKETVDRAMQKVEMLLYRPMSP